VRVLSQAGYQVKSLGRTLSPPSLEADLIVADCLALEHWQATTRREDGSPTPVLVLADYPEVESTRLSHPYVLRPLQPRELLLQVGLALQRSGVQALGAAELAGIRFRRKNDRLIGRSRPITSLYDRIALVAHTDAPVLIQGESGTGKELVARAIHYTGPRAERPFVAINCGSIPEPLLEDELFGHVRGAFTDARAERPGIFEQAQGGTVFLDEVTELPPSGQVKLLRVLQEREVRRVGGTHAVPVDVRVLAASNRNVQEALETGRIREDLYYRLNVFTLSLPSLRERPEDIPLLTAHFLALFGPESGGRVRSISAAALRRLQSHRWPGNVRELENVIRQAILLCDGEEIQADGLALPEPSADDTFLTFRQAKQRFERGYIDRVLELAAGNVTRAARLAGKDRKDFYDLMRRHGVEPGAFRDRERPR
jgi:two-component system response regulator GlrR